MPSPNIVKLFTRHGAIRVDSHALMRVCLLGDHPYNRKQLSIYTSRGNRLIDTFRTKADYAQGSTVHIDNLFATMELAEENAARIDLTIRNHTHICEVSA